MDYLIIALAGLCLGSFFNVCIYRFPREKSVVTPGSACPGCGAPVKWYDNIPVLSYILLGGKCRNCKERISLRYPVVELLTAAVYCFCYYRLGISYDFFRFCFLFSVCIQVSFIDIDYRAIPGWMCIVGMLAGIIAELFYTVYKFGASAVFMEPMTVPFIRSVAGAVISMGAAYFLKLIGDLGLWIYLALIKKEDLEGEKESLGLGDVDFLGMVGAFAGYKLGILTFFLAPFVAVSYGLYLMAAKKSHLIAYLPYLSIAAFIAVFWGEQIFKLLFQV